MAVVHLRPTRQASSVLIAKRRMKCGRSNRAIALFLRRCGRTHIESFGSGIDDKGWSDYDRNSANQHWSHESRLGPRHRIGPLQNSQQFGQHTEKRAKSLPSQFGQKYDHNSARNSSALESMTRVGRTTTAIQPTSTGLTKVDSARDIVLVRSKIRNNSANTPKRGLNLYRLNSAKNTTTIRPVTCQQTVPDTFFLPRSRTSYPMLSV